jgi:type II secretory pathway component PulF
MKLAYQAFDKAGQQVTDTIDAASAAEAAVALRRQGLYVARIAEGDDHAGLARPEPERRPSPRRLKHLAVMMRQLHVLVSCGTPLVQALAALEKQTRAGPWRTAIGDVRRRVEEGSALSVALESHPEFFDPFCRSLVAAGESSGDLAAMLDRLADTSRKQLVLRNTIIGALIYPALLAGISLAVLVLLVLVAIPKFGELFVALDVPLPPVTKALVTVSGWIRAYWYLAAAGAVSAAVGLKLWLASAAGRRALDTIALRAPRIGRIARSLATARLVRLLGVLLECNVSVLEAVALARRSLTNHHYTQLLERAEDAITRGEAISYAFRDTDLVSPSVYEAVRNGEDSGRVGPMMVNVADFLDQENEIVIRSLTSIIEPLILVAMGLLVGAVAFSMFMPLFDLTAMAGGG